MQVDEDHNGVMAHFTLSAEVLGHSGPVRCVASLPKGGRVITGSQDATATIWHPASDGASPPRLFYEAETALTAHDHWVVSVAPLPAGILQDCPEGGVVTGCLDKLVRLHDYGGSPLRVLEGHTGGVISLSWTPDGKLLSGSWDGSARVWDVSEGRCLAVLGEQENGVCVLGLPDGTIATCSTGRQDGNRVVDSTIRLWDASGKLLKSIKDHEGPVRSLSLYPNVGFVSTSNDGTIRVWSFDGSSMAVMHQPSDGGHSPFVLGGCVLSTGEVVSVDELGSCTIWRDGEVVQTVKHPGSLWAACALPDGDFATACGDHTLRIWTRSGKRVASPEVLSAFEAAVQAAATASAQGPSDVDIAKLPRWEDRASHLGKSEGQVQMFNKGGKAIAAQWSAASGAWIEIGEVTGSSGGGTLGGVQYDHVFPIEIEGRDGTVLKLQIGYNNGDNPFVTAQEFIDQHTLPQSYLSQIADYITQRAGAKVPMIGAAGGGAGDGGFSGVGDPSGFANSSVGPTAESSDSQSFLRSSHFPVRSYVAFETGALDKISAKIQEFGQEMNLSEADVQSLDDLSAVLKDASRYHSSTVKAPQISLLIKLLSWPKDKVFPCLDLCRLAVVHPNAADRLASGPEGSRMIQAVLACLSEGKDSLAVVLCGQKLLCNLFKLRALRLLAAPQVSALIEAASVMEEGPRSNKNVRLASASLLLNSAALLASADTPEQNSLESLEQLACGLADAISSGEPDDEVMYRLLAAAGTLLSLTAEKHRKAVMEIWAALDAAAGVRSQASNRTGKVGECASDLLRQVGELK